MCEPTTPIDVLDELIFAVNSLKELHENGSYKRAICKAACKGIERDIRWVIAQLEACNEGRKKILHGGVVLACRSQS
jgi:hypothetical protein